MELQCAYVVFTCSYIRWLFLSLRLYLFRSHYLSFCLIPHFCLIYHSLFHSHFHFLFHWLFFFLFHAPFGFSSFAFLHMFTYPVEISYLVCNNFFAQAFYRNALNTTRREAEANITNNITCPEHVYNKKRKKQARTQYNSTRTFNGHKAKLQRENHEPVQREHSPVNYEALSFATLGIWLSAGSHQRTVLIRFVNPRQFSLLFLTSSFFFC